MGAPVGLKFMWLATVGGLALLASPGPLIMGQTTAPLAPEPAGQPVREGVVRVGMLTYAGGKTGICFSDGFLADVERQTDTRVSRRIEVVALDGDEIFEYPFMVMSGTGPFELSQPELENLRAYLQRGGFLLASAGCSNKAWAASFGVVIERLFHGPVLEPLALDHPLFHTLYEIDRLPTRKGSAIAAMSGVQINSRIVLVFSPMGLNDTAHAGRGCCCCGGNEIRNARQVNANVLVYALTH